MVYPFVLLKGWLGGKKLQTNLPIEEVLKLLQQYQAPSGIIEKFLSYVDSGKRLQVAKNLNCHKGVIHVCIAIFFLLMTVYNI